MKKKNIFLHALRLASLALLFPLAAGAEGVASRYFHSGDGKIHLVSARGKAAFHGTYRNADGSMNPAAQQRIDRVFGAPGTTPATGVSPRFIEFLDYLEDTLKPGGTITIVSGYRSPTYNTKLREAGRLAAKASLHQYAMAADLKLSGVPSETIWNHIRELGFGGAGYYHGGLVHVDAGPARFWDETTSGVSTDISENNKLIALQTDRDIYFPGEAAALQFIRMTAYPIGVVPEVVLERIEKDGRTKPVGTLSISLAGDGANRCPQFTSIESLAGIRWLLPADIARGRYRIRATFCEKLWEEMPADVVTTEFEVR